jgi:sugar (pentulose or hexulose) kinase
MIISYLVIQFSTSSVQSTLLNRAGNNLVSEPSSASAAMSTQSGISLGSMIDDLLDAILRCLDSIEEKLQPMRHHLGAVGGDGDGVLPADDGSGGQRRHPSRG